MHDVSEKFREVIAGGHVVAQKVELLYGGEVVMDLTEREVVADGQVVAARAEVQRSGTCTLVDPSGALLPSELPTGSRLLAPAGPELRLWRGIAYHDSPAELCPLGTLRFVVNEVVEPRMSLELYDRSWAIAKAGLTDNVAIAAGTPVVVAIRRLLTAASTAGLETRFPEDLDEVTPAMTFTPGDNPWRICQDLAANVGMRLYFDPMGVCVMAPEPNPLVDPVVWAFDDLDPQNMALPGGRTRWEGTAPNLVVVVGEHTDNDTVYRAVARDDDPNSLTRYGGPYGKIHEVIRDEKIANQGQALFRARVELHKRLGLITQPALNILPNSAFEVGDIVLVRRARWNQLHLCILDGFTVPLRASGAMTVECRERHVADAGVAA